MMEKHPLGSQLFMPLQAHDYLVAVAAPGPSVLAKDVNVFLAKGHQGVNFYPGVWHHPLLVLVEQQDFIVIDRGGPGDNLVEAGLEKPVIVTLG
jgi:ureidoglycolate lyase